MINEFFSHARTALKVGLANLNIPKKSKLLLPSFVCNALIYPIVQNELCYEYYEINEDLSPDYKDIHAKIDNNTKAIILIHYFGKPQNIEKMQEFCNKMDLILIEDNSHGYKGYYKKKEIGTFGYFGISSPRKFLNVNCGGVLHLNHLKLINHNINEKYKTNKLRSFLIQNILNKFPKFKSELKKIISKKPNFLDPLEFHENEIQDKLIDSLSLKIIENTNWNNLRKERFNNYLKWQKFCFDKKLEPIFDNIEEGVNPWCYPVYINSLSEKKQLLEWAYKNNKYLFTWPSLPLDIINSENSSFKRWQKILCFSTLKF